MEEAKTAECRSCKRVLRGEPYYRGKSAYFPLDMGGGRVPVNYYGGFVCSENCDRRICLDMQNSMPGAGHSDRLDSLAARHVANNWPPQ